MEPELVRPTSVTRNVILVDAANTVVSGFWQYGLTTWGLFSSMIRFLLLCQGQWAIFCVEYQSNGIRFIGDPCDTASEAIVEPGIYIILSPDKSALTTHIINEDYRTRHPTLSDTPACADHYWTRTRLRDAKCLITGMRAVGSYERLKVVHIFPRSHDKDWILKGFPAKITDRAPLQTVGGPLKIDSIQNTMLLRSDLHDAWDDYAVAVNPDKEYTVYPFKPGYDDIAGLKLQLDHIQNPDERPLDDLFRDHFWQCILKNMKGAGGSDTDSWDYEEALGGAFDLSRTDVWGGAIGQAHLEFELGHRLHDIHVQQILEDNMAPAENDAEKEYVEKTREGD